MLQLPPLSMAADLEATRVATTPISVVLLHTLSFVGDVEPPGLN